MFSLRWWWGRCLLRGVVLLSLIGPTIGKVTCEYVFGKKISLQHCVWWDTGVPQCLREELDQISSSGLSDIDQDHTVSVPLAQVPSLKSKSTLAFGPPIQMFLLLPDKKVTSVCSTALFTNTSLPCLLNIYDCIPEQRMYISLLFILRDGINSIQISFFLKSKEERQKSYSFTTWIFLQYKDTCCRTVLLGSFLLRIFFSLKQRREKMPW